MRSASDLRRPTIALVLILLVSISAGARAATPSGGALSAPGGEVRWTGTLEQAATSLPEACIALPCDEFHVTVALPSDVWANPGGVQIGIRWASEDHDLDLYVYGPDGELAASSTGFPSKSESVLLRSAPNGTYRVVVVPSSTTGTSYAGLAEVERAVNVAPVRELLPNIISLPPTNLHFALSGYLFNVGEIGLRSCYPEETLEQNAHRCLRFDQIIANVGAGPLELRYRFDSAATTGDLRQRIYSSDGSFRERLADRMVFHPAHAHFHYPNFGQAHLYRSNENGKRLDPAPVRTGRKNGFCAIDIDNIWFGRKGDAARTYGAPACLAPASGEDVVHGISVGWADVYNWFLADQFIEVTGLPDGYYLLESVADPAGTLVEEREDDNRSAVLIRICGDHAEVVGDQTGCE